MVRIDSFLYQHIQQRRLKSSYSRHQTASEILSVNQGYLLSIFEVLICIYPTQKLCLRQNHVGYEELSEYTHMFGTHGVFISQSA